MLCEDVITNINTMKAICGKQANLEDSLETLLSSYNISVSTYDTHFIIDFMRSPIADFNEYMKSNNLHFSDEEGNEMEEMKQVAMDTILEVSEEDPHSTQQSTLSIRQIERFINGEESSVQVASTNEEKSGVSLSERSIPETSSYSVSKPTDLSNDTASIENGSALCQPEKHNSELMEKLEYPNNKVRNEMVTILQTRPEKLSLSLYHRIIFYQMESFSDAQFQSLVEGLKEMDNENGAFIEFSYNQGKMQASCPEANCNVAVYAVWKPVASSMFSKQDKLFSVWKTRVNQISQTQLGCTAVAFCDITDDGITSYS